MSITLYGISNIDNFKKARTWLAGRNTDVAWHDFKKEGVPEADLDTWLKAVGWEKLVNRQGTTWRKLTDEEKAAVADAASAVATSRRVTERTAPSASVFANIVGSRSREETCTYAPRSASDALDRSGST